MAEQAVTFDRTRMKQSFSNMAAIICTPEEVYLEFGVRKADDPSDIEVIQRIILSIPHAKRFQIALSGSLENLATKAAEAQTKVKREGKDGAQ